MTTPTRPAPYRRHTGDDSWLPWSAASLASGAVLLVMGSLALPPTPDVASLVEVARAEDAKWLMAAAAFTMASIGLTLGLPAVVPLMTVRRGWVGKVGAAVWAVGTINLTGVAVLLMFFHVTVNSGLDEAQVAALADSAVVPAYLGWSLGTFYAGELVVGLCLWRSRHVRRWIPAALLAHLALVPVSQVAPAVLHPVQEVVVGVALIGIAVQANEAWAQRRHPAAA